MKAVSLASQSGSQRSDAQQLAGWSRLRSAYRGESFVAKYQLNVGIFKFTMNENGGLVVQTELIGN